MAVDSYKVFMHSLGLSDDAHSRKTPKRVVAAMLEMTRGLRTSIRFTKFPANGTDELVIVKDISFTSLCSHHHLSFFGTAAVGYLPDKWIAGLSKIPRLIEHLARRPQVQEGLTEEIADALVEKLKPRAVFVLLEATHGCMVFRGVEKHGSKAITSALRGDREIVKALRPEFLSLVRG